MNKIIRSLYKGHVGKVRWQPLFEKLYRFSIYGMNYGNGGEFSESGELATLKYIKRRLSSSSNLTIFDVGANIGNYSVEVSNIFSDRPCKIYSFEPSQLTFQKLLETINKHPHVRPYNLGFGDIETVTVLYSDKSLSGMSSVYQRNLQHLSIALDKKEEIELTTIDSFADGNTISQIDFLKIDVEGHEMKVLEGAKNMIEKDKITFIQFEFGGTNIDARTYFRDFFYLLSGKYKIYRIVKDGLTPITNYNETCEIFTTINYLAEHKLLLQP